MNNNNVTVSGTIAEEFVFNNKVYGESFYMTRLSITRHSGTVDTIPIMVSERTLNVNKDYTGEHVTIKGSYRSHNIVTPGKQQRKLALYIFAEDVQLDSEEGTEDVNTIQLVGFVCRTVSKRTTYHGRQVADIMLAVHNRYGTSYYIPCICWSRNASYAATLSVGTQLQVTGRIQSRQYIKDAPDDKAEQYTTYEVSIQQLEVLVAGTSKE